MIQAAPQVIILIAPHFDEESVIACLSELRRQGISVSLMGVTSGLIGSENGVTLRPDSSLLAGEKLVSTRRQLLILSGGADCAAAILTDPRSHQLIQQILDTNGYVAALSWPDELVRPEWESRFIGQGGVETAVFVQQLVDWVTAVC